MHLTARIIPGNKQGDWYRAWALKDDSDKSYGMMIFNDRRDTKFTVEIYSPLYAELAPHRTMGFATRDEALTWAREQIENLPEPTVADYEAAIRKIKDYRYQSEMSDDFAYSNGTVGRWDRIERELKSRMHALVG